MSEAVQGLLQMLRLKRDPFADRERRRVMIQTQSVKLHAENGLVDSRRIIALRKVQKT